MDTKRNSIDDTEPSSSYDLSSHHSSTNVALEINDSIEELEPFANNNGMVDLKKRWTSNTKIWNYLDPMNIFWTLLPIDKPIYLTHSYTTGVLIFLVE